MIKEHCKNIHIKYPLESDCAIAIHNRSNLMNFFFFLKKKKREIISSVTENRNLIAYKIVVHFYCEPYIKCHSIEHG